MVKLSQRQKGSAHIVIIVILALVIIGALGFAFWNNSQGKNQTVKTATTTVTKPVAPQYLDASDWSVKFTVPMGLNVNNIVYYKTHIAEGPEFYGFTTNRVKAQGDICDNEAVGNLVVLNRSSTKSGEGTLINNDPIGGYYYFLDDTPVESSSNCLKTDIAVQDRALLDELVKSLVISETTISIKELGVSITVPDSIQDLTYTYTLTNGVGSASFSTTTITNDYEGCGSSGNAPPLGDLEKVNGTYPSGDQAGPALIRQFPAYYIARETPQAACWTNQTPGPNPLFPQLTDFNNSLSTIKEL